MKILITALVLFAWASHAHAEWGTEPDPNERLLIQHSTTQRDAPTTRFYTPDGKSAGSATTYGNTTTFYGPDGRVTDRATRNQEC
jgi:hypothetical protein